MATVTPGTGGTFKATTAEGALIEAANYLQDLEASTTGAANNVSVSYNFDQARVTISASLPIIFSIGTAGETVIEADEYV